MDDIPICPPWWPQVLWQLHYPNEVVFPHNRPNPVNYPPEINRILIGLLNYSSTYQIADDGVAIELREIAVKEVVAAASELGRQAQ